MQGFVVLFGLFDFFFSIINTIVLLIGVAIVTNNAAAMWTDGRYYLQAASQMDENWTLMKHGKMISLNKFIRTGSRISWVKSYSPSPIIITHIRRFILRSEDFISYWWPTTVLPLVVFLFSIPECDVLWSCWSHTDWRMKHFTWVKIIGLGKHKLTQSKMVC